MKNLFSGDVIQFHKIGSRFFLSFKDLVFVLFEDNKGARVQFLLGTTLHRTYTYADPPTKNTVFKSFLEDCYFLGRQSKDFERLMLWAREDKNNFKFGEEKVEKADRPIEDLKLSARAYNALKKAEIVNISQIPKTQKELLKLKNMGKKSAAEILEKING